MIVERLPHAVQVRAGRQHHEQVEDLVRAAPDVEPAREVPLRPAERVEKRSEDVHGAMRHHPGQAHASVHLPPAVDEQAVGDGDHAGEAEADKNASSEGPPLWRAEMLQPRDDATARAEKADLVPVSARRGMFMMGETHNGQVNSHQIGPTKEAVVHGRHVAPDNEEDNAYVVKLVSHAADGG